MPDSIDAQRVAIKRILSLTRIHWGLDDASANGRMPSTAARHAHKRPARLASRAYARQSLLARIREMKAA